MLGRGESVGNALTNHPRVDMVSITGDIATGKKVLQAAAKSVKRTHLELGGKASVIVYDDADLDAEVSGLRAFGYYNAGQDCTAACRIYTGPKSMTGWWRTFLRRSPPSSSTRRTTASTKWGR